MKIHLAQIVIIILNRYGFVEGRLAASIRRVLIMFVPRLFLSVE